MLTSLLALALLAQLSDDEPTPAQRLIARTSQRELVEQLLEDGRHVRFGTASQGPVHVWRPRGYHLETAETVVYLHGFYSDVDQAMLAHQLATQFRDSGRNALFVVCETRSWRTDPLVWPDLEALLAMVEQRARLRRPQGPVTVVSHSGGYKTVVEWLKHEALSRVVLVDGLYGNDEDFSRWLKPEATRRQLVLVGFDTQQRTDAFLRGHGAAMRLDDLPYLYDELPANLARARLLYLQSERFDHMGLVTSGRLLPWLLHVLR